MLFLSLNHSPQLPRVFVVSVRFSFFIVTTVWIAVISDSVCKLNNFVFAYGIFCFMLNCILKSSGKHCFLFRFLSVGIKNSNKYKFYAINFFLYASCVTKNGMLHRNTQLVSIWYLLYIKWQVIHPIKLVVCNNHTRN